MPPSSTSPPYCSPYRAPYCSLHPSLFPVLPPRAAPRPLPPSCSPYETDCFRRTYLWAHMAFRQRDVSISLAECHVRPKCGALGARHGSAAGQTPTSPDAAPRGADESKSALSTSAPSARAPPALAPSSAPGLAPPNSLRAHRSTRGAGSAPRVKSLATVAAWLLSACLASRSGACDAPAWRACAGCIRASGGAQARLVVRTAPRPESECKATNQNCHGPPKQLRNAEPRRGKAPRCGSVPLDSRRLAL